jgi:CHAT domain-containing protein/tetratricopeptide (TPR) repeat protein
MRKVFLIIILVSLIYVATPLVVSGQNIESNLDSIRASIQSLLDRGLRLRLEFAYSAIDSALLLFDSAYQLAESNFGPNDTLIAIALYGQAACNAWKYNCARGYDEAKRAINIWERNIGPDHPPIAYNLWIIGDYYVYWGKYALAETVYLKGIELLEKNPDYDQHHLGLIKNNLGLLYFLQNRLDKASLYLNQASDIWKTVDGPASWWYGVSLANIASLNLYRNDFKKADKLIHQAINIIEQSMGADHWTITSVYGTMGDYFMARGEYQNASVYYNMALTTLENIYGPEDMHLTIYQLALARAKFAMGNEGKAVNLLEQAAELGEGKIQGIYDPDAAFLKSQLANMYYAIGNIEQSHNTYMEVINDRKEFIDGVFPYASENYKMRYISQNPLVDNSFLTLAVNSNLEYILSSALFMLLTGKSIVIDVLSSEKEIAFCTENEIILQKTQKYSDICTEIANLTITKPNIRGLQDSLVHLHALKSKLETEISRSCREFRDSLNSGHITMEDITRSVPVNTALLEFCRYYPLDLDMIGRNRGKREPHYLVFTLNSKGHITLNDLGEADIIDSLVDTFHEAMLRAPSIIYGNSEKDAAMVLLDITDKLYDLVFALPENSLTETEQIYISTDGQLNLLPFEVLTDSNGKYLIEKYQISYLSSGRDLLKYKRKKSLCGECALILVNPDFEEASPSKSLHVFASVDSKKTNVETRGPADLNMCLGGLFTPLPAAYLEGDSITDLLSNNTKLDITFLYGDMATEEYLKNVSEPPRILHLATHGYYCRKETCSDHSGLSENPLLYSGLALAGANKTITHDSTSLNSKLSEDGILTSLEVSGLNLVGTDLVVLSACQTGLGEVHDGEGVFGLRRAFQHAGAQSIIMSMWPIPDVTTLNIMVDFYSKWLSGKSKSAALRLAMLDQLEKIRAENRFAHPLYWGGFILVGNAN